MRRTLLVAAAALAALAGPARAADPELVGVQRASRRGFTLTGRGSGSVTTARFFRPGARYPVRVGARRRTLRASAAGRLRIAVPLGPGNPRQEFTAGAATRVFRARVTIGR